jgi:hypothetical protein
MFPAFSPATEGQFHNVDYQSNCYMIAKNPTNAYKVMPDGFYRKEMAELMCQEVNATLLTVDAEDVNLVLVNTSSKFNVSLEL